MNKANSLNLRKIFRMVFATSLALVIFVITSNSYLYGMASNTKSNENNITVKEIAMAQKEWAAGIVKIGKVYTEHGNYKKVAKNLINKLYAYNYGEGIVLFKPTKATQVPFRKTKGSALSYFIGGHIKEDDGFAIHPWTKVVFNNDEVIYFHGDMAIAMGTYSFTDVKGAVSKVEYTFGYVKLPQGQLKIVLHHSSLPYSSS